MICFPNCKINLGLYVTRRRDDGYHDIETVFYPLSAIASAKEDPTRRSFSEGGSLSNAPAMLDVLEIVPATETKLHLSGLAVSGNNDDNLVWKAYQLLHAQFPGKLPPLDIYLHKVIPMGAGLGGGSADGSFMLRLLNDYCSLGLSTEQLLALALQLGSDCPFFIHNTPQFASGRGEQMSSVPVDLSAYSIQVVCPQVHVATGAAFKMIQSQKAGYDLRQLHSLPPTVWKEHISNNFEAPVFQQHPQLAAIKDQLYAQGAIYASMSGSGSAIYGIFPKSQQAQIVTDVPFSMFYIA
ncbi:MAG: 4-(cytidine 5-diphospho)-2-C-methyl-D-erythritol kinase [Flavipsychrobacter sp.]|nr:4-(cytidine 5-diphospho)-2-C-methyl-D-erythritol kinase [Flavipsychrobacter sp.]